MSLLLFPDPPAAIPRSDLPPDWQAREDALNTAESCIVEAPAGSGKTGLLIQRYLKLLASVDAPEEVMALTFTNKATAEMRDRVLSALESAGAAEVVSAGAQDFKTRTQSLARAVLERDRVQGWRLSEEVHRLNIRTIDAFCGELAQTAPLLGSGTGQATPLQDPSDLYSRAARAVLMRLGGEDAELHAAIRTVLLHRDADLSECERLLAEMLSTREQWSELIPLSEEVLRDDLLDGEVLPRLNEALRSAVCGALSDLHVRFPEEALRDLSLIAQELAHADGYNGAPSVYQPCASMHRPPGTSADEVDRWLLFAKLLLTQDGSWRKGFSVNTIGAKVSKEIRSRLERLIEELKPKEDFQSLLHAVRSLPPVVYPREQWLVAKALFRLLGYAIAELRLLFLREGVCDFAEQALLARTALEGEAGEGRLEQSSGLRLRHLLVDEMQDTSSSQYELLERLTAGWAGTKRTVFLVGDPKQSIYLFRQARVERFLTSMAAGKLGDLRLHRLRLSANFRSGARLVSEFNSTFGKVFPPDRPAIGDVVYTPAVAVEPASEGEQWSWHANRLPPVSDGEERTTLRRESDREEAEEITQLVHQWRGTPLPEGRTRPWSIVVLARARTHVASVTAALQEAAIPFRAVEIDRLDERPEVMDAVALTRALLHPADRTAWLAVLRAPWCGLGLRDLHIVAADDDGHTRKQALRPHLRDRAQGLPEDARARLLRTLDVLDAAAEQRGRVGISAWVERTWFSLGGNACTSVLGRENVRAYFQLLDSMELRRETVDAATLGRRLKRLYAEPSHAADAVDVMTIHKAKGLEWDVVLLPGLQKQSGHDQFPLLDWIELPTRSPNGEREVLLAPIGSKGEEQGSLNSFIRGMRRRREEAEVKRLLYVALTRARTALHLFASPVTNKDGDVKPRGGTLLCAAWPAALDAFADAPVPLRRSVLSMPKQMESSEGLALAAAEAPAAVEAPRPRQRLRRLSLSHNVRSRIRVAGPPPPAADSAVSPAKPMQMERRSGSREARALGDAVHAFAEHLAARIARLENAPEQVFAGLLAELPGWTGRVQAFLRASGLGPGEVRSIGDRTLTALRRMLEDKDGRWILLPHRGASSERAFAAEAEDESTSQVRPDRSFFAGVEPGASGDDVFWIVDFKTADSGDRDAAEFVRKERERYEGQLRAYAEVHRHRLPESTPIMLALYYPLMQRLVPWSYAT